MPKRYSTALALLGVLAALTLAACAPSAPKEYTDGAEIAQVRCTGCHDLTRLKEAQYDRVGWQLAVSRMIARGALLSDNEAATLIDFLAQGGASQL